jgi:uncharacterized protein YbaA (DUF1428 family)
MQMTNCNNCDGYGKLESVITVTKSEASNRLPNIAYIDKRSRHYRDAVKDIMAANPEISRDDAMKLFDKAYTKS